MLQAMNIAKYFLVDALETAGHIRIREPQAGYQRIQHRSNFGEASSPIYLTCGHMAPSASTIREELSKKLEDLAKPAIPIGYAQSQKACKLWDFETVVEVVSRNAVFNELSTAAPNTLVDSCRKEKTDLQLEMEPEKVADECNNDSLPTAVKNNSKQIR